MGFTLAVRLLLCTPGVLVVCRPHCRIWLCGAIALSSIVLTRYLSTLPGKLFRSLTGACILRLWTLTLPGPGDLLAVAIIGLPVVAFLAIAMLHSCHAHVVLQPFRWSILCCGVL